MAITFHYVLEMSATLTESTYKIMVDSWKDSIILTNLKNVKVLRSEPQPMAKCIPMPDNEKQFYTFINMVINNRSGDAKYSDSRPKHVGPHKVTYERNEVGEHFMVVDDNKGQKFIEMILDQFYCLRTYIDNIRDAEDYPEHDKYEPKL